MSPGLKIPGSHRKQADGRVGSASRSKLSDAAAPSPSRTGRAALERIDRAMVRAFGLQSLPQRSWLLESRVSKRAADLQLSGIDEYAEFIERRPKELDRLFELIRIGETSWMRHAKYLDQLIGDHLQDKDRRMEIWSAGCGTGQEAYSVAMLLLEVGRGDFHVMGTDLSERAVEQAARGFYDEALARGLDENLRRKYWISHDGGIEAGVKLRRTCSFSRQNLLSDPLPKPQDAILCRNVLMYFEPRAAELVLERLISALKPGGLLVLGPSELGRAAADRLEPLRKSGGLIWRRPDGDRKRGSEIEPPTVPALRIAVAPSQPKRQALAEELFVLDGIYPDERIAELEASLSQRMARAPKGIVVDMDRAGFLCDEAARVFFRAAYHLETFGKRLVIRATRIGVRRWIQRCGLAHLLEDSDKGGGHGR